MQGKVGNSGSLRHRSGEDLRRKVWATAIAITVVLIMMDAW